MPEKGKQENQPMNSGLPHLSFQQTKPAFGKIRDLRIRLLMNEIALEFEYAQVPRIRVSSSRKRSAEMAIAQDPAIDDCAANRDSHFDCWWSRERCRASSPARL
jgi:hypothetical protein